MSNFSDEYTQEFDKQRNLRTKGMKPEGRGTFQATNPRTGQKEQFGPPNRKSMVKGLRKRDLQPSMRQMRDLDTTLERMHEE